MDDLGITLCYHDRDGRREYFVYLLSMDYGDEYPGAMEILGAAWTLEGAKESFDDDAPWEKVEGLPVWHYTDINGHHYAIQEVPVA